MKFRVHQIPLDGLHLSFNIKPESLPKPSHPRSDENFTHPIEVTMEAVKEDDHVSLRGQVATDISALCYRCGRTFDHHVNQNVDVICIPQNQLSRRGKYGTQNPPPETESDEGIVFFKNNEIDAEAIACEQLFLSLPMRYLCSPSCVPNPDTQKPI